MTMRHLAAALSGFLLFAVPLCATAQTPVSLGLAGSNTIGQKLAADLVEGFATAQGFPSTQLISDAKPEEYDIQATRAEDGTQLRAHVEAHGTGTGAEKLLKGKADFWMASRQANQKDLDEAAKAGAAPVPPLAEMLAPGAENVIALDAVLVIVSPRNPVRSLSLAQLRDVYAGKVNNWSQVGGPDLPISVFARDTNSGTFDTFCALVKVADCKKTIPAIAKKMFESSEDLSDTVAAGLGNIGFVGFAYARNARVVPVVSDCNILSYPNGFAVKAEEYPLSRRLFFYSYGPQSKTAKQFLEFVKSDAAQPVIKDAGFIDFRPELAPDDYAGNRLDAAGNALDGGKTRIRPSDKHKFEDAVQNANRLPITFRYRAGSDELDSRSEEDLRRLAALMRTPAFATQEVVLIGFTQAQGDYEANRQLSLSRAAAVRERLKTTAGFTRVAAVFGVGPAAPVACNSDANARFLNQRVEVWVRPGAKPAVK